VPEPPVAGDGVAAGLLKHVALVEDSHFARLLRDEPLRPPWDHVDLVADPDWERRTAADDSPEELMQLWRAAVSRSRTLVDEALATAGHPRCVCLTERRVTEPAPDPLRPGGGLRRHLGHADLIRESVDGLTGESP